MIACHQGDHHRQFVLPCARKEKEQTSRLLTIVSVSKSLHSAVSLSAPRMLHSPGNNWPALSETPKLVRFRDS
jgi:hypothetical protein